MVGWDGRTDELGPRSALIALFRLLVCGQRAFQSIGIGFDARQLCKGRVTLGELSFPREKSGEEDLCFQRFHRRWGSGPRESTPPRHPLKWIYDDC